MNLLNSDRQTLLGVNMVNTENLNSRIKDRLSNEIQRSIEIAQRNSHIPESDNVHMNNPHYIELAYLYVDLSGYTMLTDENRMKSVMRIINVFLFAMSDITRAYSGRPVGIAGDRLLSIFHKSNTGEGNECQKAVDCAISMNSILNNVITPFAQNLLQENIGLQVSIGIDYGYVMMTRFRTGDFDEYVFVGNPANFAAKLQNWTAKGSLRISGNVYNNLRNPDRNWTRIRNRYGNRVYWFRFD